MPKFKIEDKLKVIKYGLLVYQPKSEPLALNTVIYNENDEGYSYDVFPDWIGMEGKVLEIKETEFGLKYKLSVPGDPEMFYEDQLIKL